MAKGYYLVVGDKTTCGGVITEGDPTHTLMGKSVAREQDRVTCGIFPGIFIIVGHVPNDSVNGRKFAGTLHSQSTCPCQSRFIPSMVNDTYELGSGGSGETQSELQQSFIKDETSQRKIYGRKIIILDYENKKPILDVEVKINAGNKKYYLSPDNSGQIETIITENNSEDIMVEIFHVF